MSLVFALTLMVLVVVPLVAWAVGADRRRRLEAGEPHARRKEEVA
jgi:hypothetical protein